MKFDVIDFIRESAKFLCADRPDVYPNEATAVTELSEVMEALRQKTYQFSCVSFTSYLMCRVIEDGVEEFILTRKLSGLLLFEEEEECRVYSYHGKIDLPDILDDSQDT